MEGGSSDCATMVGYQLDQVHTEALSLRGRPTRLGLDWMLILVASLRRLCEIPPGLDAGLRREVQYQIMMLIII